MKFILPIIALSAALYSPPAAAQAGCLEVDSICSPLGHIVQVATANEYVSVWNKSPYPLRMGGWIIYGSTLVSNQRYDIPFAPGDLHGFDDGNTDPSAQTSFVFCLNGQRPVIDRDQYGALYGECRL